MSQVDVSNIETSRDNLVDAFAERVLREPWGTVAKSQLEQLVFTLLVESGKIRLDRSDFQLANDLQTSTTKARALMYRYEQDRVSSNPRNLFDFLTDQTFTLSKAPGDLDSVRAQIRSKYVREYIVSKLQDRRVPFTREPFSDAIILARDAFAALVISIGLDGWIENDDGAAHNALFQELTLLQGEATQDAVSGFLKRRFAFDVSIDSVAAVLKDLLTLGP